MRLRRVYPYIIICLIAFMILYPQIHAHAFIYGVDSAFHMNRFYDTAMQIKTGQYSYFQSFFGFQQSGRVVNALYGPLFAYFNGVLLLLAQTWYRYQIWSSFLVLFISGSLMYHLGIKNRIQPPVGIIIAALYMMSDPVMAWVVGQQFTGWGAAFLPLALLMGTEMVRTQRISVLPMALSMAILLQVHVMTSLMATLALVPFLAVTLIITNQRGRLVKKLLLSIGLTALLTANVWGGMLELATTNHLLPVAPGINVSVTAPRVAGQSQVDLASSASTGVGSGLNTLGINLPYLLILLALLIGLAISWRHVPLTMWLITATGIGFLWIASEYFPWHFLARIFPTLDYIQFPARFLVVAIVLMLLGFGMLLSQVHRGWLWIIVRLFFVTYGLLMFNQSAYQEVQSGVAAYYSKTVVLPDRNLTVSQHNPVKLRALFNSLDLAQAINTFNKPTPDYLPFFVKINPDQYWVYHPYHLYKSQILPDLTTTKQPAVETVQKVVQQNALEVTWLNPLNHKWWIAIPVIKYANTVVEMNGKRVDVDTSTIGKLFIDSHPGINHAKIYYQAPWWFNGLALITVASWLGLVGFKLMILVNRLKKLKRI